MNQALKESIPSTQEAFICLYKNSKQQISIQELVNTALNESGKSQYVQGWSLKHHRPITLLTERIIQTFSNYDEALAVFEDGNFEQSNEIKLPNINRLSSPETMDICFTGFDKQEKAELSKLAESNKMVIRKSVTRHLNILCFGKNAGPSKLAQANSQGVIILNRTQLEKLIDTGELPDALAEDIELKDTTPRKKTLDQSDLVSNINNHLVGLKEIPRRENLIAMFENNHAIGWKFHVTEVFKEALDIKRTPMCINSQTVHTWTQGHAYSFKQGDAIGSLSTKDWKSFLKNDGMLLQVLYANPAGFEENQRLEGSFNGTYYQSKTHRTARNISDETIDVSSSVYDSGVLTVDVFRVNEEQSGVKKVDSIALSQVDFVTLLQQGYYWKKPLDKDDETPIEKVVLIP